MIGLSKRLVREYFNDRQCLHTFNGIARKTGLEKSVVAKSRAISRIIRLANNPVVWLGKRHEDSDICEYWVKHDPRYFAKIAPFIDLSLSIAMDRLEIDDIVSNPFKKYIVNGFRNHAILDIHEERDDGLLQRIADSITDPYDRIFIMVVVAKVTSHECADVICDIDSSTRIGDLFNDESGKIWLPKELSVINNSALQWFCYEVAKRIMPGVLPDDVDFMVSPTINEAFAKRFGTHADEYDEDITAESFSKYVFVGRDGMIKAFHDIIIRLLITDEHAAFTIEKFVKDNASLLCLITSDVWIYLGYLPKCIRVIINRIILIDGSCLDPFSSSSDDEDTDESSDESSSEESSSEEDADESSSEEDMDEDTDESSDESSSEEDADESSDEDE